ncbi:MAG: FecR domain-containing protein [Parvibaculaceae bacterium]
MAATPIGKVVAVVGSPTSSGRAIKAGSPVYENDRLETGRGNIQIIFVDNTKLVVGPNSTLVIDRFLLRGGKRAQKFSVDALRGTFRFISGNMAKNAYDIQTANATIGIRGTAFDFSSGGTTLVAVLDGRVRLCASGECETIPDNCGVGRARGDDVDELGGRAKGRALRSLPYIINQGALTRPFRLNTQSCRSSAALYENFFGGGQNSNGGRGGSTRSGPDNGGGGSDGEGGGDQGPGGID